MLSGPEEYLQDDGAQIQVHYRSVWRCRWKRMTDGGGRFSQLLRPGTGGSFPDYLPVARAYPANNFGGQRWYQQYFAQDDICVIPQLTVNIGLRYEYSPWLNGYKGQLGTFDPTKTKPIIVEGNTSQVDLTSQYAAPAVYQFFGQYIQTSSQAGLPYSITYTDRTQFARG